MKARRILMTTDAVGGVWQYALELAGGLARNGDQVLLASLGPEPSRPKRAEAEAVAGVELVCVDGALEWMPDAEGDRARQRDRLLELARAFGPDVIHLNGYDHATARWPAPILLVAHSCVCSWWQACHGTEPPVDWTPYRRRVAAGIRSADLVVAPTAAFLSEVARLHGLPRAMRVIRNGRDPMCFVPREKRRYLMGVGRYWDEGKNFAALDEAAQHLDWPVMFAGSMIDPADGRGREPRAIDWVGAVPQREVARLLGHCAIYVHPARYEPFGLSVLEAALCGCALVLGDIPTLRELWDGAAEFVDPRDTRALTQALNALVGDPARIESLGRCARQRARYFRADRMVQAYSEAYAELATSAHRTREAVA